MFTPCKLAAAGSPRWASWQRGVFQRPAGYPTLLDKGYTFRFPELEPALRDLLGR